MKEEFYNMVLGRYKIEYDNGVTQIKNLIDHSDYLEEIKPALAEIDLLQSKKKYKQADALKHWIYRKCGKQWFTNKSPLYFSIQSGILSLPKQQGGDHVVKWVSLRPEGQLC